MVIGINNVVCGNTMCVSTYKVEFVLRELSCFILTTTVE